MYIYFLVNIQEILSIILVLLCDVGTGQCERDHLITPLRDIRYSIQFTFFLGYNFTCLSSFYHTKSLCSLHPRGGSFSVSHIQEVTKLYYG